MPYGLESHTSSPRCSTVEVFAGSAPSKGPNGLHFVLKVECDFQAEATVWFVRTEIGLWILTASK